MTTLESLGFTVALAAVAFTASSLAFGCAIRNHSVFVSPRCIARPKQVIYNAQAPKGSAQYRGGNGCFAASFGWMRWVLSIPYDVMLDGVPGTGTREGGMSGNMLKLGLDAVVLLRFHVVGLKISALATALLLVIMLPIYAKSECYGAVSSTDPSLGIISEDNKTTPVYSTANETVVYGQPTCNLTNYERLTLANIPSLAQSTSYGESFVHPQEAHILSKLYVCCFILWILMAYLLYLLQQEWVQILAMRRVYYFERDIYGQRKQEYADMMRRKTKSKSKEEEKHLIERDPWIPHPEQRETVPSIDLFSVLVGGLPQPPRQSSSSDDDAVENQLSKRESIDWQLSLCCSFFDHCVPNQPGFSSSVAAVSILPDVRDISIAWKKWYTAAAKLRRLRFIQKQISERNGNDEEKQLTRGKANIKDENDNDNEDDNFFVDDDDDDGDAYILSLHFGPEQTAVHSREFAQAAASCCPNGFMEDRVLNATLNELREMERVMEEEMKEAVLDLSMARHAVVAEQDKLVNADKTAHRNDVVVAPMKRTSPLGSSTTQRQTTTSTPTKHISSSIRNFEYLGESVAGSQRSSAPSWSLVQHMISERYSTSRRQSSVKISDGILRWPTMRGCARSCGKKTKRWLRTVFTLLFTRTKEAVDLSSESTYAVVTFTSRQAAVAARHNLVDGRGLNTWLNLVDIPVPPLADGDSISFRSCCRPITLTIENKHKSWRSWCALVLLISIYVFYTVPLTAASHLVAPGSLQYVWPSAYAWVKTTLPNASSVVSGLLQALIWSAFFASCPSLFKFIANFGSNATSFANAEYSALKYFWWFMVVTAFSGPLLAQIFLTGLNSYNLTGELMDVLRSIAAIVPTTLAATWINWMITQGYIMLPLNYLLSMNSFIFHWLGIPCCSRMMRGGGPGGTLPYRLYVDTGMGILCVLALAPASPLVAPACLVYFMFGQPLLRRNMIFVYRPRFDGGGHRWPFLFDMVMSALLLGQILLCIQMVLKAAVGPAVVAGLPILVTCIFYKAMNKRYRRPFKDTALLQTSLLDGWDTSQTQTFKEREEFRKFLVDAHKAAYVPICIAGNDKETTLTSEPAVTLPMFEQEADESKTDDIGPADSSLRKRVSIDTASRVKQPGATLRRAAHLVMSMRNSDPLPRPAMPLQSPPTHTQSTPASLDVGNGSAISTIRTSLFTAEKLIVI